MPERGLIERLQARALRQRRVAERLPEEGRRRGFPCLLLAMLVLVGAVATAVAAPTPPRTSYRAEIEPGNVALLTRQGELFLEAVPLEGEGILSFARRFCAAEGAAEAIAEANGGSRLLTGVRYRVPFELLTDAHQVRVIQALFPGDQPEPAGWRHLVRTEGLVHGANLWQVTRWFTGQGEHFAQVREANGLVDDHLRPGQSLWIPAALLRGSLRQALPDTGSAPLEYRQENGEDYAVYRLQPGEALYSSVVVRFTGRVFADDVNALAGEIAERSGIADVTDIPIGYRVRIPMGLLLPEYLPAGHPRRLEYEASLSDSRRFANPVQSKRLEGITVILDPGHGGADVGTSVNGVWESLYVYDIMVRVKTVLESRTAARVVPTIRDGDRFRIPDVDVLPYSRGHQVLTDPPYPIADSRVGVHLRWYLANSVLRQAARRGDANKVIFISIHADSLHPSLRGAMAYIPSARLTAGRMGRTGPVYVARREVREQPYVELDGRQRIESEGLSRQLADSVISSFAGSSLAVHPYKPVRERIIRQRSEFVPAVLRHNEVPAKILLEVCNLANAEDRRLIQTRAFRQQVAEAIVAGILDYYGEGSAEGSPARLVRGP